MRTGRMIWDLSIEAPGRVDDGYGGATTKWFEQFTTRGEVLFLQGGESVMASRLAGRQPVVIRLRSSTASREIRTDWRVTDQRSQINYAIKGVKETPDRLWIEITAESGVAQ